MPARLFHGVLLFHNPLGNSSGHLFQFRLKHDSSDVERRKSWLILKFEPYNTGLTSTSLVSLKDSLCPSSVKRWHIAKRPTTTSAGRTVWPINSTIPIPMVPIIKPRGSRPRRNYTAD